MNGDGTTPTAPPEPPPPPPPPPSDPRGTWPSPYSWVAGERPRRRRRVQMAIAVVVAGLVVGAAIALPLALLGRSSSGGAPTGGSNSGSQALTIYRQALANMRSAAGFHYNATVSGAGDQHTVGDSGQNSGRQDITVSSAFGDEHFTLLLTGGRVYFQGNVPAFQDQLGVSASKAASLQSSWIVVANGDGPYSTLQAGITASDQANETVLEPTSTSQVTVSGVKATRLQGTVPPQNGAPGGTGHLDVTADTHQPLSYFASISQNGVTITSSVTFSAWGAAPNVTAPANAVAWSTLGASPPPGGYGNGGGPGGATPPGTI